MQEKLKVLIDGRCVRPSMTGVGLYARSLTLAAARRAPNCDFHVLALAEESWGSVLPPNLSLHPCRIDYESHPMGDLWEQLVLPHIVRRHAVDVFWGPAFLIPWGKSGCPRVVTIHDLTVFTSPASYPRSFATYMRTVIRRSIRAAETVTTVSRTVANEIRCAWPTAADRIEVVPNGVDDCFFASETQTVPPDVQQPYILGVGAGSPRKNLEYAAQVVEFLRKHHGLTYAFVAVGEVSAAPPGAIAIPWQSKKALARYYRHAELLLFPSLDEGFGVPLLEAMACGCPVAASRRGAIPEVVGDAALLFALEEGPAITAKHIAALLRDTDRLAAMRAAGKARAAQFTWDAAAEKLLQVLGRLARTSGHER